MSSKQPKQEQLVRERSAGRSQPPEPPAFDSDAEEAAWLESEEGQRFLVGSPMEPVRFVPRDRSLIPVTIRLPASLRARIRRLAERRGMGYQTLARQWLMERCDAEERGT